MICGTRQGACIQCPKGKCQVGFHVECARRANYHMEIEKTGKDVIKLLHGLPVLYFRLPIQYIVKNIGLSLSRKIYNLWKSFKRLT